MIETVPGLSEALASHPVILECYRLTLECDRRPVPKCGVGFRTGDGPSKDQVRALEPQI